MTKDTTIVTRVEKLIITAALFDLAKMVAQMAGRLDRNDLLNDSEEEAILGNMVQVQSLVASILDIRKDDLHKAAVLSSSDAEGLLKRIESILDFQASA